jgi:hypothetical protein
VGGGCWCCGGFSSGAEHQQVWGGCLSGQCCSFMGGARCLWGRLSFMGEGLV